MESSQLQEHFHQVTFSDDENIVFCGDDLQITLICKIKFMKISEKTSNFLSVQPFAWEFLQSNGRS